MERSPLSRFELVRPLGRGAMGEVWLARERASGAEVALKRLTGTIGRDELARFAREAQALGRLSDPGIVGLVAWGVEAGCPWLAMEHLRGGTLHERVARTGPLEPREAARIGAQLGRALAHAHAAGVIHRDVKPENLLLDDQGGVRLVDFGLCRPVALGGSLTASGALVGTPAFAAPEQLRGDTRAVGPAVDTYGLGGVLYYLLTAAPPNRGQTLMEVLQAAHAGPRPPSQLRPGLDPGLEQVVLRCLAPDPGDRYLDPRAAAEALDAWLARAVETTRAGGRRAPWALVAAGLALALGAALLVGARPAPLPARTGAPAAPQQAEAMEQERALQRARDAVARSDYRSALLELDQVLARDPACTPAYMGRGQCRIELGDPVGALADAQRAVELSPDRADAWLVLAHVRGRRGEPAQAGVALERARALDPASPTSHLVRARVLAGQGQLEQALQELEQALRQEPGHPEAQLLRGGFLCLSGRLDEALAQAEVCLQRDPQDERPWELRARVRLARGDREGALSDAARALSLAPHSMRGRHVRASALLQGGDLRQALEEVERGLASNPGDPALLALRGEVRLGLEDVAGARADLAGLRALDDRERALLAEAELEAGRLDRAGELLAGSSDPQLPEAVVGRARLSAARGDRAGAIRLLDALIEAGQGGFAALALRGSLLLGEERLPEALADLERALDLRPRSTAVLCDRGLVRVALGDEAGLLDIERARELDPGPGPLYARAVAWIRLGRYEQAEAQLEALTAQHPHARQTPGARHLLEMLRERAR